VRHAQAQQITVTITFARHYASLAVRDGGHGFDPAHPPKSEGGFGLLSLKKRAKQIHGVVKIESAPAAGTTISLSVPFSRGGKVSAPVGKKNPSALSRLCQPQP
jgi:signal transduction histidine kinase